LSLNAATCARWSTASLIVHDRVDLWASGSPQGDGLTMLGAATAALAA
jgi:hypothetical protein